MKDAEFIYSLYVQANPVPDPALLPLTRDEAALLSFERSPDMIDQKQSEKDLAQPPRRRGIAAALAAAAVLIVVIAGAAILLNGDSGPVAGADANPAVVFDGTTCSYAGPTLIEEGSVEFSLTNSADEAVDIIYWKLDEPELSQELEDWPVGTDSPIAPDDPMPSNEYAMATVFPGLTIPNSWSLTPGTYLLDCASGNPADYVWRIAQVEVVAP